MNKQQILRLAELILDEATAQNTIAAEKYETNKMEATMRMTTTHTLVAIGNCLKKLVEEQ